MQTEPDIKASQGPFWLRSTRHNSSLPLTNARVFIPERFLQQFKCELPPDAQMSEHSPQVVVLFGEFRMLGPAGGLCHCRQLWEVPVPSPLPAYVEDVHCQLPTPAACCCCHTSSLRCWCTHPFRPISRNESSCKLPLVVVFYHSNREITNTQLHPSKYVSFLHKSCMNTHFVPMM